MSNKITLTVDEEKLRRMITELYSSYEQLLDVEENEWAEEVRKLHRYFSDLLDKEIS